VFVVDTNVLVYAADRASLAHDPCRRKLLEWRSQATPWFLSWGIAYEFLRVVTHPKVLRQPWTVAAAWEFVDGLRASQSFSFLTETDSHAAIVAEMLREVPRLRGNVLHDAHVAALMREHGIHVIYTCDTDFHRFPFLEVRDPLA
jgi:hypothetical protein